MKENGWKRADNWSKNANKIALTKVGGSKQHEKPDFGPVRVRKAWMELGVDDSGVANDTPKEEFEGMLRLTPRMMARISDLLLDLAV